MLRIKTEQSPQEDPCLKERLLDLNPVSLRGKAIVVYSFNQIEKQEPM